MREAKELLMKQAQIQHTTIFPCGVHGSLEESFTVDDGVLYFWFNTKDRSTHVMARKIS